MRQLAVAMTGLYAAWFAVYASAQSSGEFDAAKEIVFNPLKGNCIACHGFPALREVAPTGNSGPPIIAMQARFPKKSVLRDKIWDPTVSNPNSFMPPFGKHKVLNDDEIDKVVDFIFSL